MVFSKADLCALARETQRGICVSIYSPTHRFGRQKEQDPIRLRNLIRSAERRLRSEGIRVSDAAAMLEPAREAVRSPGFWRHPNNGLAIFLSPEVSRFYRLPIRPDRTLVIGRRFHIRPLMPLMYENGQYCILALSRDGVRLYWGNREGSSFFEGDAVPGSTAGGVPADRSGKQLQWHTRTGDLADRGRRAAMFHGQGAGIDRRKNGILRYFQRVDRGLLPLLRGRNTPLIVAGVEYLLPIYRKANTYPHLIAVLPVGNPGRMTDRQLHRLAWEAVRPVFHRRQRDAFLSFRRLAGAGDSRACMDLLTILPAAFQGRVESAFIDAQEQAWGYYSAQTGEGKLLGRREPGSEDLLELAAVRIFLGGGQVFTVHRSRIPAEAKIAALLAS